VDASFAFSKLYSFQFFRLQLTTNPVTEFLNLMVQIVFLSFISFFHFLLLKPVTIVYNEHKLLHHKHQIGTQKGQ